MKKPERSVEEIIHIIKRYTHDRSESGYDDIMGSCGYPCRQCDKDKRMLKDIKEVLTAERQKREEVVGIKHKIEVLDNGAVLTVDNTHRFYGSKRMTKPLMYEYEISLTQTNNPK